MMYAIDFGTSNTVITRWNADTQRPETVSLKELSTQQKGNPPLVPSLLYVEQAAETAEASKGLAGQAVRDRGLDIANDPRFFRNFKRGIGISVQGFMPELDGHAMTFEQVGSGFLHQVVTQLRAQDADFDGLIFTVPVDSFEAYRLWLGEVCQSLDVEQVKLLDEPTAAALGYQLSPEERTLLVVDFGGGTLDFSLVQLTFTREKPTGFLLKWGKKSQARQSKAKRATETVRVLEIVQGTIDPQVNAIGTLVVGVSITLVVSSQALIFFRLQKAAS